MKRSKTRNAKLVQFMKLASQYKHRMLVDSDDVDPGDESVLLQRIPPEQLEPAIEASTAILRSLMTNTAPSIWEAERTPSTSTPIRAGRTIPKARSSLNPHLLAQALHPLLMPQAFRTGGLIQTEQLGAGKRRTQHTNLLPKS